MNDCVFCLILAKKIPTTFIAENDFCFVIKDITPKATIHYLIIPKKHITNVAFFTPDDKEIAGALVMMAQQLSEKDTQHKEFRLIANSGKSAGQSVFHTHFHFLAGREFGDLV